MSNKSLVVAIAILFSGLLASQAWAAEYSDLEKKIEELSKEIQKLEGMVKDLSFQVQQTQAIASVVKEFSFELKKAESSLRELQGINKKVTEEIQPRLLTLEGTIQGVAASFKEKHDSLQGRVFDLETSVQGLDARLKSVEGKVRELLDLDSHVQQLEKRLSALEQQVGKTVGMPPDAAKFMMKIQELSDRLQTLEQTIATLPIADLSDQISKNRARLSSLEISKANTEEVEALQARIMQLEQQLQAEVEEVKTQTSMNTALAGLGLAAALVALASIFGII